jgi:hypothetical protein
MTAEITVEDLRKTRTLARSARVYERVIHALSPTRAIPAQTAQGCAFDARVYSAIRAREEAGGAICADYGAEIAQWAENRAISADAIWSNPRTLRCAYAQQKLDDAQIARMESDLLRYAARSTHVEAFG